MPSHFFGRKTCIRLRETHFKDGILHFHLSSTLKNSRPKALILSRSPKTNSPTDTAARRATHFQNLRSGTSCEKKGKAPIFVGPNLQEEDADGEDDAD